MPLVSKWNSKIKLNAQKDQIVIPPHGPRCQRAHGHQAEHGPIVIPPYGPPLERARCEGHKDGAAIGGAADSRMRRMVFLF